MMRRFALTTGTATVQFMHHVGGMSLLFSNMVKEVFRKPFYPFLIIEQIYHIGIKSMVLVSVTAISTGMVMALQFGYGLERFGGKYYVPKLVALSLVRELAPIFASLMLAGRVGAGITAEIGSMAVTQQIDAIRALGTSPIKKIVIPRVVACVISLPILTGVANLIGIVGGLLVSTAELNLDPTFFLNKAITGIKINDFIVGVGKTVFFASFISIVGCYFGMTTKGGTQEVGVSTTRSVVTSSILIVVSDFFLTKLFWVFERWH